MMTVSVIQTTKFQIALILVSCQGLHFLSCIMYPNYVGTRGCHLMLELAPEQQILQRDLTKNTKEILEYYFFPFIFKFSSCEMSIKGIDQFV